MNSKHGQNRAMAAADVRAKATANFKTSPAVIGGMLLVAVGLVFGSCLTFDFVNYDDYIFVCDNPHVVHGLTIKSVWWSATAVCNSMWAPLTWLSYQLDAQVYGMAPWGFHLTNVLLHAAVTVLLFGSLWRMTDSLWPSALSAALFALHPLRAESVAWVAERKGLLCGLFFASSLVAYLCYIRKPSSRRRYWSVSVLFLCSLLAKPAAITLPFLFLLLDYWPLRRFPHCSPSNGFVNWRQCRGLLIEKTPLFAFAALFCVVAPLTQGDAVVGVKDASLSLRIGQSLIAYVVYLKQFCYPLNLATAQLRPDSVPLWQAVGAALLLLGVSVAAWRTRRRWPWFFVGWFWYVGMLAPVSGLVPLGRHGLADRYTYLPQIGLDVIVAWSVVRFVEALPQCRRLIIVASVVVIALMMVMTWSQATVWAESETLWRHTLASMPQNEVACSNLCSHLKRQGRIAEATDFCRNVIRESPTSAAGYVNFGSLLALQDRDDEAIAMFEKALKLDAEQFSAHNNLAAIHAKRGQFQTAIAHCLAALRLSPKSADVHANLANLLMHEHCIDEAIQHYKIALAQDPDDGSVSRALRNALEKRTLEKQNAVGK